MRHEPPTVVDKEVKGDDAQGQADEVQEELAMVVDANAVVDPGAVATEVSKQLRLKN